MKYFKKYFYAVIIFSIFIFAPTIAAASQRPVMKEYIPLPPEYEILKTLPQKYRVAVLPDSFDWRDVGGTNWITAVKNQGTCGSCWAFAATGQLEAAMRILSNKPELPIDLAEQELVSCDNTYNGCYGGNFPISYFKDIGLIDEECFPYDTTQDTSYWFPCEDICDDADFRHNYGMRAQIVDANYNLSDVKSTVFHIPMFFTIAIYNSFWTLGEVSEDYVWSPDTSDPYDEIVGYHAMLCVGWNDAQGCFIFKNSWGEDFGANGYVKIAYDCLSSSAPKPVWADGYLFVTDAVSAKIVQNWTISGFLIKSDTSFWDVSSTPRNIETSQFFSKSNNWYIIENWNWTKDLIDTIETGSGDGSSFTEAVDAPMTIEWECAETTAAATECLSNDNLIVYPNPFNPKSGSQSTISFKICKEGYIDAKIYDAGYNLVRELLSSQYYSTGIYDIFWDGKTDDGRIAVPGVYFIVVKNLAGEYGVSKIIVEF